MLWLTVSQSVSQCLGVKFTLELVTRYYFLSESWCVVSVGSPLTIFLKSQSQSHVTTNGRSVIMSWCQVHSGAWWPDIIFYLKLAVLSMWGALSDERSGLPPVSHCHQCLLHCQRFNIIYIVHVTCFKYMQYILDLCQHTLSTADHAKIYATTAV
jgi:hypothetical protein